MILIKNCQVFAPENIGKKDVLIAGETIVGISEEIKAPSGIDIKIIEADNLIMIPGLIDNHAHIAGAGGEGGPASRTPEIRLSEFLLSGVTSVVGCLGADGLTRTLQELLMKVKSLKQEGISAWMYTGSFQVPTPTLLGDVGKDIAMIEEVIGAGEIAISDLRSSLPSISELVRLADHARLGGIFGSKCGILKIHMGDAKNPYQPIYDAVSISELKLKHFYPTHCNRNPIILEHSKKYGKNGFIDLTSGSHAFFPEVEIKPSQAIKKLVNAGVPAEHITVSSDASGSFPVLDKKGEVTGVDKKEVISLFNELKDLVLHEKFSLDQALRHFTSNVADILWLRKKGNISPGKDADLVIIDRQFNIIHLVAMGQIMIEDSKLLKKGIYEKN